jgi:hypothetical protein
MEAKVIDYEKENSVKHAKSFWKKMFSFMSKEPTSRDTTPTPIPNDKTMWVPDEKAPTCYNCQKQFKAIFLRKHHCRICGNVFCKDCSSKTVDGKYWGSRKDIKVCDYCYEMYKKLDETLVETTIDNTHNFIEDIDSIEDNVKNLKRETKLSEYCKKYKKETEEYFKFLQMDKKYEDGVKQNLENFYDQLVKHFIEVVLRNENLYEKWFDRIYDLTKKTISQVNPSFKDLKDSMNINDYVKIKTIPYKDQSQCKVIDGFAFQKNVASKTMNTNIDNPKILLLDCGLDYNRNCDNITNFENLMTLEPAYFNIIMKKIELVEPTVILVNKNVSRKIQETLAISNKISLVMNVKSSSLRKIARCTKTYVLPSTDLIDGQTILGTCKKFRIEKMKTCYTGNKNKNDILKANEFNLMVFEGCDYVLYNTIILSGPDENELKILKKLMRTILLTVRDLYLQKIFLYFSYCDYPDMNELSNNDMISRVSISSSKNSSISGISYSGNSQTLFIHRHIPNMNPTPHQLINNLIPEEKFEKNQNFEKFEKNEKIQNFEKNSNPLNPLIRDFLNGFDTCIFSEKSQMFNIVKLTISQGIVNSNVTLEKFFSNFPAEKSIMVQPGAFTGGTNTCTHELAESEVLKKVNSICEEPQDLELMFYSDKEDYDKPLGKLIIDLCYEADSKCDVCKKLKSSHIYYIYKKIGRLKIETIQNIGENNSNDKIEQIMEWINRESTDFAKYNIYSKNEKSLSTKNMNYNIDIFSYGVCNICQNVVTPLMKVPRELFNFSVAMFFKFMLYNHDLRNRSDRRDFNLTKQYIANNDCKHFVNRDISRIFITKMGSIKFSYEDSPIYIIETSPMNEKSDLKYFSIILEAYIQNTREKSLEILSSLLLNFKFYLEHLNEISMHLSEGIIPSNTAQIVNSNLEKIGKIINKYINVSNDIINFVDSLFNPNLQSKFDDYVKALVFIKRVFFRIVQVKIVQNHIKKIIRKVKASINYIIRMKVLGQQNIVEGNNNNNLSEKISNLNNTLIVNSPQNNNIINTSISSTLLPLDIETQQNSVYENIDNKETYKSILKEISFFDENHTKYSSDHSEEDLSSIIAYTLTSDKYREFISPNNRFKLIEIKCERKPKMPFDCMQHFRENIKKSYYDGGCTSNVNNNMKQNNNINIEEQGTENKYGYNFFTTQDEEVHETSLLFDQSKNTYQYQNLDNHKIYQQLETELLSDEKVHFTYSTSSSSIMSYLSTWNLPIEFFRKKTEKVERERERERERDHSNINNNINNVSTQNSPNVQNINLNLTTPTNTTTIMSSNQNLNHVINNSTNKLVKEKSLQCLDSTQIGAQSSTTEMPLVEKSPLNSPQLQNIIPNVNTTPLTIEKIYQSQLQDQSDEKIILQGDNIKITLEEVENIRKDLKSLKEKNPGLNSETKAKRKVSDFLEESMLVSLEYEVIAYYPRQFEALRITYCATYDEFILSVSF